MFGAGRKRRRLQLAAARQWKVNLSAVVDSEMQPEAATEPSDSGHHPTERTERTERKFGMLAGGAAAGEMVPVGVRLRMRLSATTSTIVTRCVMLSGPALPAA